MENLIPIEFHNIQSVYSIDFIRKCVGKSISLLNNFKEYYKNVEVKPIDVLSFKKNNYYILKYVITITYKIFKITF